MVPFVVRTGRRPWHRRCRSLHFPAGCDIGPIQHHIQPPTWLPTTSRCDSERSRRFPSRPRRAF
jgi:hypothetical protein